MARVEIPAPGDLVMDEDGNVRQNETVSLKLAGTSTDVTHYSALTGGTSTTGGLKSGSDGTIVDGSGNRRYVDSGTAMDLTILSRTRQIEATSAAVDIRIINVRAAPYNARGDGATDDSTAIQAAINSVQQTGVGSALAVGAIIYFPPTDNGYLCSTGLNLDNLRNITLMGTGTTLGGGSRLIYSGSGTAISAQSSQGFRMDSLYVEAFSAAIVLDMTRKTSAPIGDTTLWVLENSTLRSTNGATGPILLKTAKATLGTCRSVNFYGGEYAVDSGAASTVYSNNHKFDACHFQFQKTAPIHNPLASWTFTDCEFEPLNSGAAGALLYNYGSTDGTTYLGALRVNGCRFEDADGTGSWIKILGNTRSTVHDVGGIDISGGNHFSNGAKHIEITGSDPVDGLFIERNYHLGFDASTVHIDLGTSLPTNTSIGPNYHRVGTYISGALGAGSTVLDGAFGLVQVPPTDSASSVASTYNRRLTVANTGVTIASGTVYAGRVIVQNGGSFTKVRLGTGQNAPAGSPTDFRVGVWDSAGVKITETANAVATVVNADDEYELSLLATVTPKVGDIIFLGLGRIGGSAFQVLALSFRSSKVSGLAPSIQAGASSWLTTTVLPNLSVSSPSFSSIVPWVELVP